MEKLWSNQKRRNSKIHTKNHFPNTAYISFIWMADTDPVTTICTPIMDEDRLRNLQENVSRMCKTDRSSIFPGI